MRTAFDEDRLEVAYQPIVQSADGLVTGVEALLRWTDPQRGAVPTTSVVELAEKVGLMADIGAWVLERACIDRAQWLHDSPAAPLDLAVNISSRQLMGPGFCETVAGVLERTAMDPTALVLEMTENILIADTERAVSVLADLNELGIRVAVDDFGTGYSSLSSLRRLPIHIVKIDQSVIADIGNVSTAGAIVAAVTDVAHAFGLTVTAEGVETQRQHDQVNRDRHRRSPRGTSTRRPDGRLRDPCRAVGGPVRRTASAGQVPQPMQWRPRLPRHQETARPRSV